MKKRAVFLIGTGCLLLTAALSLIVNNQLESAKAARSAEILAEAYLSQTTGFEQPAIESASELVQLNVICGAGDARANQPLVIDGQEYIGLLSIPSLGVNLPVNNNISYPLLKATPCRYYGSAEADSLIIAAHNYSGHFGRIDTLKPGDRVCLSDAGGMTEKYAVSQILTLSGDAVDEMLDPDGWDLTLFTCTYSGTNRIAVRCVIEYEA